MSATDFDKKCEILAELWLNYRDEEEYEEYISYNDLGLPLAYMLAHGIVKNPSEYAMVFVDEAFDLLLSTLGIQEDPGFDNIEEIFGTEVSGWGEEEEEEEDWEDPESDYIDLEEEEEEEPEDRYNEGFNDGAQAEQQRIQEVILMHKRWAKEKNRGSEFMFWDSAGEVLTPINFEYSEEAYRKSLEDDGF